LVLGVERESEEKKEKSGHGVPCPYRARELAEL
jgi:hypothetical protein